MWTSPLLRRMRAWRRDTFRSVSRIVLPSFRPIVISSRIRGTTVVFPSSSWITSLNIGVVPRGWLTPGQEPSVNVSLVVPVEAQREQLSVRLLAPTVQRLTGELGRDRQLGIVVVPLIDNGTTSSAGATPTALTHDDLVGSE